jgi:hypothetical protein
MFISLLNIFFRASNTRLERWRSELEEEKKLIKERNELAKKVAAEEIPDPTTISIEEASHKQV